MCIHPYVALLGELQHEAFVKAAPKLTHNQIE